MRFFFACALGILAMIAVGSTRTAANGPGRAASIEPELTAADRAHWAFHKPVQPAVPEVGNPNWVQTPVDAFVLAKLAAAGLRPAPPADKATLLRRVTFNLTGLPPTPDELANFLSDSRPDAYER